MRRFRVPEVVLGIFLGIAFCLFGAGVTSYQAEHCERAAKTTAASRESTHPGPPNFQKNQDGDKHASEHAKHPPLFSCGVTGIPKSLVGFMDSHEGFFVGGFTFALAIATVLLWHATNNLYEAGERQIRMTRTVAAVQARNTRRQLALTDKTTENQLRAYIAMIPIEFGGFRVADTAAIKWSIKNHGQTPATGIKHVFEIAIIAGAAPDLFSYKPPTKTIPNGFTLLPQDSTDVRFYDSHPFTAQEIAAVSANASRIYVWGFTEYTDAFGKGWKLRLNASCGGTNFALALNPPPNATGSKPPKWNWEYGPGHNDIEPA